MDDKKLTDCTVEELSDHIEHWWSARVAQSYGGNLNDHNYLMLVVNGLVQDTGELLNITRGILNRLKEATDPHKSSNGSGEHETSQEASPSGPYPQQQQVPQQGSGE